MTKLKPMMTYIITTVLVLWVLLGAVTLPNSSKWFKGEGFSIKEGQLFTFYSIIHTVYIDIVSFRYSDQKIRDAIPQKPSQRIFNSNIYSIENTPKAPKHGLYVCV
jgi:hypothetical protein